MNKLAVASAQLGFLFCCFSLCFLSGLGDKPSNGTTPATSHKSSSPSTGVKFLIAVLILVTVLAFSFLLFKLWQRKKRQEQQARFLKLFEDDDELEVELGIRD